MARGKSKTPGGETSADSGADKAPVVQMYPKRRGNPNIAQVARESAAKRREARQQRIADGTQDLPTRWAQYVAGDLTVRDMDDEELARKQFRIRDGSFASRPPDLSRRQMNEMNDELLRRGQNGFHMYGPKAIKVVAQLMMSSDDDNVRLRAANIFLERTYGKVPDVIKAQVAGKWDETFESVIAEFNDKTA